jgi:periplasmic divalent cation tolerance protein
MSKSQIRQQSEAGSWLHVQTTVSTLEDAQRLSRGLVEARLAACVQIQPGVESTYRWQGKIEQEPECVLVIKSHASLWESLVQWLHDHHAYDCPQIIALPLTHVSPAFEAWLVEQLFDLKSTDPSPSEG